MKTLRESDVRNCPEYSLNNMTNIDTSLTQV